MSSLAICNGPDCTITSYQPTKDKWITVVRWTERSLDFHSWACLRAYAEQEALRARD